MCLTSRVGPYGRNKTPEIICLRGAEVDRSISGSSTKVPMDSPSVLFYQCGKKITTLNKSVYISTEPSEYFVVGWHWF